MFIIYVPLLSSLKQKYGFSRIFYIFQNFYFLKEKIKFFNIFNFKIKIFNSTTNKYNTGLN